ncbi:endo alpha-1,4 polygalactosaminidase [Kribbella sancticallisti]|uniref:Endo alpha-1,4 polygalactosaminidase n=1 Tax=Kribbella sancticallisti TaxID=460087 RepID=A0ABN2CEI6_9ACTN
MSKVFSTRPLLVAAVAATAAAVLAVVNHNPAEAAVTLPPVHAGFDYQLDGPYTPPDGVQVVSRDRTAPPAAGLYNICYVNAFQVQPGEQDEWDPDLLLRDAQGNLVIDEDWGEPLLDIRPGKAERVAATVNGWIDGCADSGYQAIEPDNYDSFSRSKDLLTTADAKAFLTLLAEHAHQRGLAIGQKNTVELAGDREAIGLDFAVAEQCGEYDECGQYVDAFGDNVLVIEYTDEGLSTACAGYGDRLSIVRRDVDVSTPGSSGYVRKTC